MARGNHTGKGGFKEHPENINKNGQRNAESVAFTRALRQALVDSGNEPSSVRKLATQGMTRYQAMIQSIWKKAERGTPWAVEFIAERTEGRVTQPIGQDPAMPFGGKKIVVADLANANKL